MGFRGHDMAIGARPKSIINIPLFVDWGSCFGHLSTLVQSIAFPPLSLLTPVAAFAEQAIVVRLEIFLLVCCHGNKVNLSGWYTVFVHPFNKCLIELLTTKRPVWLTCKICTRSLGRLEAGFFKVCFTEAGFRSRATMATKAALS